MLETTANKLLLQRKAKGANAVRARTKEDLEEEGRGHVIGDRDRCRGIEGLCWVEITHHQRLQQGLQGGGREGCHLRDPVHLPSINAWEGRGFYSFLCNIRLNKASPALYLCSFVLLELGYLGATDLVSSISGHFATGLELGGIGEIGNFTV